MSSPFPLSYPRPFQACLLQRGTSTISRRSSGTPGGPTTGSSARCKTPRRRPDERSTCSAHLLRVQDMQHGRVQGGHRPRRSVPLEGRGPGSVRRTGLGKREALGNASQAVFAGRPRPGFAYANSEGTPFETPLRDILTHVANHGTHHRAQIVLVLREAKIAPPPTDYIFYVRKE